MRQSQRCPAPLRDLLLPSEKEIPFAMVVGGVVGVCAGNALRVTFFYEF